MQHRGAVEVAADARHREPGTGSTSSSNSSIRGERRRTHCPVRARDVDRSRRRRPRRRRCRRRSAGATCRSRRCRPAPSTRCRVASSRTGTQSHSTLPSGVCTSSARWPIATGGSTPMPSSPGSSSRTSFRGSRSSSAACRPALAVPPDVLPLVEADLALPGRSSVSSCCTPQVAQIHAGMSAPSVNGPSPPHAEKTRVERPEPSPPWRNAMADVRQHKILLDESEMPTRAGTTSSTTCRRPPPPVLHPGTGQPVGPEDLAPLFPMDLILQEVIAPTSTSTSPTRCSTSTGCGGRARCSGRTGWRRRSARPARIYYKYEGVSPAGSHKPNTSVPQAYYNAKAGIKKLTTETGAGPVGHGAGVRLRAVRPRVRGLAGAGVVRPEALPQDDDRDLRRHRAPEPVGPHRGRPRDPRRAPGLHRVAGHRDQRGRRGGRPGPDDQLRARQRAQPRADAPDDHRRGGAAAAGQGGRDRPTCWSAAPAAARTSAD